MGRLLDKGHSGTRHGPVLGATLILEGLGWMNGWVDGQVQFGKKPVQWCCCQAGGSGSDEQR